MATVDREIADLMVVCNGKYMDDPQVFRIVEYDNAWDGVGYGLEYAGEIGRYGPSQYVKNPRTYWEFNED